MKTTYRYCHEQKRLVDVSEVQAAPAEPKYDPSALYDDYMNGPRSGQFMACRTCGGIHETSHWPHNCMPEQFDLAHEYAGIATISDSLEGYGLNGIQSQADGRWHTSKSRLRADYRALGMVEMGNDAARHKPFKRPKPDRKQIKEALHKAMHIVKNEGGTAAAYRARSKGAKAAFGPVAK